MKIAYYSHYFSPEIGAPSARIHDLAREWTASGHKVQVATCFPNHPVGEIYPGYQSAFYMKEVMDGIDVHRHWTYITPNKGFVKKTVGHVSYLPSALLCHSRMEPASVCIGTSPTFFAAMAAAAAGARFQAPFVMEIRDLWPAIFVELGVVRNHRIIRWLEKLEMGLYRQATRIVTVTEAFRQNLIQRNIPANKVHTIPNGADTEFWFPQDKFNNLRSDLGLSDAFVVLYIGAHGISHALSSVLESAHQLSDFEKIRFVFVGEGAEKEKLMRKARDMNLRNVIFHEPVNKEAVRAFYAMSDVCLVPLRNIPLFDGFIPSKMFEIMAMGRPILASLRGEAAAILEKSGAALLAAPEDSGAIAGGIREFFENPGKCEALGKNGRRFVMEYYSRKKLSENYIEVLDEAVREYGREKR